MTTTSHPARQADSSEVLAGIKVPLTISDGLMNSHALVDRFTFRYRMVWTRAGRSPRDLALACQDSRRRCALPGRIAPPCTVASRVNPDTPAQGEALQEAKAAHVGARSRNRTDMMLPSRDFKSLASTSFAIRAAMHVAASAVQRNYRRNRNPGRSRDFDVRWISDRIWRPRSELNRRTRICSPLHNHSATRPDDC